MSGALPLEMIVARQEQGKPFIGSYAELRRERLLVMINAAKEKWDTILILVVLLGGLIGIINPRSDAIENRLGRLEKAASDNDKAIVQIENKFDNLADMMIVAHTNGEVTEEELRAIWERVVEGN